MRHGIKVATFVTLAVYLLVAMPQVHGTSAQDAALAIASANHALQTAFVNVLDIEKNGVNVSVLIYQLNDAGLSLTMADTALSNGNYSEAVNRAAASKALADSVVTDAVAMKSQAPSWLSSFLPPLTMSFVSSGVFIVFLALTWLWFKRYYVRKLSESRPKVTA